MNTNTEVKAENQEKQPSVSGHVEPVVSRIEDIAIELCDDYPEVDTCKPLEQLYAIEESFKGVNAANRDLHQIIMKLRGKFGMSLEEYIEFVESC